MMLKRRPFVPHSGGKKTQREITVDDSVPLTRSPQKNTAFCSTAVTNTPHVVYNCAPVENVYSVLTDI